ncbi:transposase [Neisseria macacae ATCC 33926]|uniref:Transposase n=1 Tax=Neisseria macacae ATCC 33926 TaxID=997348 RepID=A0AA36XLH6_9NEIS|nr:transposase [Neisseria macacae ATCC 33926]
MRFESFQTTFRRFKNNGRYYSGLTSNQDKAKRSSKYSGLNLNQDKATKPQTVQIVRQGEATPYWFKVNPL